ncbi:MAG: Lrp/AsnC family transcriptional regulator [Clostridia bacterium]|nr:Lrp/AsnC family transcriptional regulator [Clostridia bacterium]
MDDIDRYLADHLQRDARASWSELGRAVGLTGPAVAERVRKLERMGWIQGYHAHLNPARWGFGLMAFVAVTISAPEYYPGFLAAIAGRPEVLECHHVTGDDSYLLKVTVPDTTHLETFIMEVLKTLPGVQRTRTTIVMSSPKEWSPLPLSQM